MVAEPSFTSAHLLLVYASVGSLTLASTGEWSDGRQIGRGCGIPSALLMRVERGAVGLWNEWGDVE